MLFFKPTSPGRPGLWCIRRARIRRQLPRHMKAYDLWTPEGHWKGLYGTWIEAMSATTIQEAL